MLASLKASGVNPYPHKFEVGMQIVEYINKFGSLADGERGSDIVSVAGTLDHSTPFKEHSNLGSFVQSGKKT